MFPSSTSFSGDEHSQCVTNAAGLEDTTGTFDLNAEPGNPRLQTLLEALLRDPIAIIRSIINTIRSSQLHRTRFRELVETGNREGRWKLPDGRVIRIDFRTLLRDSRLRWGSIFLMIDRFLYLRQASFV